MVWLIWLVRQNTPSVPLSGLQTVCPGMQSCRSESVSNPAPVLFGRAFLITPFCPQKRPLDRRLVMLPFGHDSQSGFIVRLNAERQPEAFFQYNANAVISLDGQPGASAPHSITEGLSLRIADSLRVQGR